MTYNFFNKYDFADYSLERKILNGIIHQIQWVMCYENDAKERVEILKLLGYSAFYDKIDNKYRVWWSFLKIKDCVKYD